MTEFVTTTPAALFAAEVVRKLQTAGYVAYWAGGCVRDLLRGETPEDYDVATSAAPDEVRHLFGKRRTLAIGAAFGVILVRGQPGEGDVEVATFRTEGPYKDGRRPDRVAFCTAEEDAVRRDFTINGMFYDPLAQRVMDYVGGEADLRAGIVRAIGDPVARFEEDKLRMLRAVRMTARFGFQLDEPTARAVTAHAASITVVSRERVAQELKKMLLNERRVVALTLARDLGLLRVLFPDWPTESIDAWQPVLARLSRLVSPGFPLALASLWHDLAPEVVHDLGRGLRLSNDEIGQTVWLVAEAARTHGVADWSLARQKRLLAEPGANDLIALVRAGREAVGQPADDADFLARRQREWSVQEINPPALISGQDLIAAGLRPGPRFKALLEALRDAQLNGEIGTPESAIGLARTWIAGNLRGV